MLNINCLSIMDSFKINEKYTRICSLLKIQMYKSTGSGLSMFITFLIYCALKNTRAARFLIQEMFIDPLREHALAIRSWCYHSPDDPSCLFYMSHDYRVSERVSIVTLYMLALIVIYLFYIFQEFFVRQLWDIIARPLFTVLSTWLLARYCNSISIGCDIDIFTVYLFMWQLVSLIYQWLHQQLPMLSFTLHQKATCLYMAFVGFIIYDILILVFPIYALFVWLWLNALLDIIICLHVTLPTADTLFDDEYKCLSIGYPTAPIGMYMFDDINRINDEGENADVSFKSIGWGDFMIFNILLLSVIPASSSITVKACIAFGCIVTVQLADLCTDLLMDSSGLEIWPGVPVPTIAVSAYAIILDVIINYFNLDCENFLQDGINLHSEL